jgi:hypothetical protein
MNVRPLCTLAVVAAALTPLLWTAPAAAQQPDGARFRGGVELEVGALVPVGGVGSGALGSLLVRGQLGVQINHNWGVWGTPILGAAFGGGLAGPAVGVGAMGEYTFDNIPIGVGAGPEAGVLVIAGGCGAGSLGCAAAAAAFYGIVLRGSYYPIMTRGENGIRRKALVVGIDLHLDGGGFAFATSTTGAAASSFLIAPTAFIGYQAF